MKRILTLIPILVVLFLTTSCKDKDSEGTPQPTEKDKILVNYPWKLTDVTDLSGKTIAVEKLNSQTQFIKLMEIEFVSGNKVYARGTGDSQVINGGTWYLVDDTKTLDIKITGFSGVFGLQELTNSRMKLKSTMPVSGVEQETIMVFAPVIK